MFATPCILNDPRMKDIPNPPTCSGNTSSGAAGPPIPPIYYLHIFQGGQTEVLDWLLEQTQARDEILPLANKKSLLHHAAKFGQESCLRTVLEKLNGMGRLTACCDGNGNSPAHVAAKHGHLSCLQVKISSASCSKNITSGYENWCYSFTLR